MKQPKPGRLPIYMYRESQLLHVQCTLEQAAQWQRDPEFAAWWRQRENDRLIESRRRYDGLMN